jgi:hypothetical protein
MQSCFNQQFFSFFNQNNEILIQRKMYALRLNDIFHITMIFCGLKFFFRFSPEMVANDTQRFQFQRLKEIYIYL